MFYKKLWVTHYFKTSFPPHFFLFISYSFPSCNWITWDSEWIMNESISSVLILCMASVQLEPSSSMLTNQDTDHAILHEIARHASGRQTLILACCPCVWERHAQLSMFMNMISIFLLFLTLSRWHPDSAPSSSSWRYAHVRRGSAPSTSTSGGLRGWGGSCGAVQWPVRWRRPPVGP